MATPLKEMFTPTLITDLGRSIQKRQASFDVPAFSDAVFDSHWEDKELKQRLRHITLCLGEFMPRNFDASIAIFWDVAAEMPNGFEFMFFPDYVEVFGLDHWETSMKALAHFTQFSSSEFAIRPFILQDPDRGIQQMKAWSDHPNFHVRRLASEGCRPRLPWAMALNNFKGDPSPILPILENLKSDPELYVRRSVANNLNDISKDHPKLAMQLATHWFGEHPDTDWIVKHAMRGLLKKGETNAMRLFGFEDPKHIEITTPCHPESIAIGDSLHTEFILKNPSPSKIRLEYVIDYVKLRGKIGPKVFQISEKTYPSGNHTIRFKQGFKDLSTRTHHRGIHQLHIKVNGVVKASSQFELN